MSFNLFRMGFNFMIFLSDLIWKVGWTDLMLWYDFRSLNLDNDSVDYSLQKELLKEALVVFPYE